MPQLPLIPSCPFQLQSTDFSPSGSETESPGERQGPPDAGIGAQEAPGAARVCNVGRALWLEVGAAELAGLEAC